jgi:response regulator NasT
VNNKNPAGKARHILAVDDDAISLDTLAEGLAEAGYEVVAAKSGEEALECAKTRRFDLAVLDMQMPGISGAELARRLLGEFGCYSLILSGRSDGNSVQAAAKDGALGYLVKPVGIAGLVPAIETAIARSTDMDHVTRDRDHLCAALREGRETSIAVGILAERMRLDRESAFNLLRDASRNERKRIAQVAESIVHATETVNGFRPPQPQP